MLDYCMILYAHLSMRLRSMNELVPFAEQYCRLSAESEGENCRYWCDEAYIIRFVHALIISSFKATRQSGEVSLDSSFESLMLDTLRGDQPWTLGKWIQAASLLDIALDEKRRPSLDMDMHHVFSEDDLSLLGKLYDYYLSVQSRCNKPQSLAAESVGSSEQKDDTRK